MTATYYSPSGKFSPLAIPITLLGGTVVSIIVAALYAYAILYIPVAGTVTFILTGGAGFVVGVALTMLLQKTHVRSTPVALGLSLLVSLVFFYLAWSTWVYALLRRGDEPADISWVALTLNPFALWDLVKKVNEVGAWNLKGATPTGGFLWFLWALEALILIGIPTFIGMTVPDSPYCETAEDWLVEEKAVLIGAGASKETVKQKAEQSDFAGLFQPLTDPSDAITLSLWSGPKAELHTVVINSVKITMKNNKPETDTKELVRHLVISRPQLEGIRALAQRRASEVQAAASTAAAP